MAHHDDYLSHLCALRDMQDSWLYPSESIASGFGVQELASHMEPLNLFNLYDFHDYSTNQFHQAALQDITITQPTHSNAIPTQIQEHRDSIGSFPMWVSFAKDPCGYRLLRRRIDNATPQEIDKIIKELKDHLHELMKHPFGNLVILNFFQSNNVSMDQLKKIILYFITMDEQKLKDVCIDDHGNWAMQKILENIKHVNMNLGFAIMCAMKPITVALMKNINGGYVIQQCLKLFPPYYTNLITLDEVAKNCFEIAQDICGCSVIQKCLDHVEGRAFSQIVNGIISNVGVLAKDPYGNYVVQFLIKKQIMETNANLIALLRNRFVELSMNKYASNVVEDLLQFSEMKDTEIIVLELIHSLEFLDVIMDPYGNYVVQMALKCTEGRLLKCLCNVILCHYRDLHSHHLGRIVVASAKASLIRA